MRITKAIKRIDRKPVGTNCGFIKGGAQDCAIYLSVQFLVNTLFRHSA